MMTPIRIAILGAGIMGTSLALYLARRGREVTLFDREAMPLAGASRWNEGKIHLGYLYGADPSLQTARKVLTGGLRFGPLVEDLTGRPIAPHVTPDDDLYLVHSKSVVDADALAAQFAAVDELVRAHPDAAGYLADASAARSVRLAPREVVAIADPDTIVAGFRTCERSVNTRLVADALADALRAEPRITFRPGVTITAAMPEDLPQGRWRVTGAPAVDESFDLVINALWHGRIAIDRTAGILPEGAWSNRYRLSLFVRTARPLATPSAIISVGPFGDVKNYNGRDFYLSWYPAGLVSETANIDPPAITPDTPEGRARRIAAIRAGLVPLLPWAGDILDAAKTVRVKGGWVFARAQGSLADRRASIHRRDRFGIERRGAYLSIDTGKYSTAPLMAQAIAAEICGT